MGVSQGRSAVPWTDRIVVDFDSLRLTCINSVAHTRFFCELAYMESVQRDGGGKKGSLIILPLFETTYEVQLLLWLKRHNLVSMKFFFVSGRDVKSHTSSTLSWLICCEAC